MSALMIALLLLGGGPREGRIEGHVHYPACFGPPADLQVCAERADGLRRCTSKLAATEIGFAYHLDVPPGEYLVFAITETYFPGYRAFYGAAVRCGLSIECQNHAPIPVNVRAGKILRGIDPDDWYAPHDLPALEPSV